MDTVSVRECKRQIRRSILAARRRLPEEERIARSRRVWEHLTALPCYRRARVILWYMAFDKEVLTEGLIRLALAEGKRVILPVVRADRHTMEFSEIHDIECDVAPGYGGILEPRAECRRPVVVEAIELIILPGVAFDPQGGRLGFGAGLYDRVLAGFPRHIPKVGMAFDFQVVPWLPRQPHDVLLDGIVTESRAMWCRPMLGGDEAVAAARSVDGDAGGGRCEQPWTERIS